MTPNRRIGRWVKGGRFRIPALHVWPRIGIDSAPLAIRSKNSLLQD
jgi:hypothetical protein